MVKTKISIFVVLFFILESDTGLTQTNEYLLKQANAFFDNRQYHRANEIYRNLAGVIPNDIDFLMKRANAEFETNHLDSADAIMNRMRKLAGNNTGMIHFLKGKLEMEKGRFENAAKHFKLALNSTSVTDKVRTTLIDDIKRCGVGESFANIPEQIFLEQVGADVNTIWDETNPVYSINTDSKFYFNSNREHPGAISNTSHDFELPFDMYSTSLTNGEWSEINALNTDLNSPAHDLLIDFNENGQIVYFKSGPKLNDLKIKADTLSFGKSLRTGAMDNPYILPGDELFFFTDTFVMISGVRPGGYGGVRYLLLYATGKRMVASNQFRI
jgi:tetratricopeptide (TPR) repeat protein